MVVADEVGAEQHQLDAKGGDLKGRERLGFGTHGGEADACIRQQHPDRPPLEPHILWQLGLLCRERDGRRPEDGGEELEAGEQQHALAHIEAERERRRERHGGARPASSGRPLCRAGPGLALL